MNRWILDFYDISVKFLARPTDKSDEGVYPQRKRVREYLAITVGRGHSGNADQYQHLSDQCPSPS